MRRKVIIGAIMWGIVLFIANTVSAIQILPTPLADRKFQYVRIEEIFTGSPLATKALVPNALIVIGTEEKGSIVRQAIAVAYMLGLWTQDPGSSVEKIKKNITLAPVITDGEVSPEITKNYNLIVIGRHNKIYKKFKERLHGQRTFIEVVKDAFVKGRDVMFVSDARATFYLANRRLYFKAGAYNGYFNFVKARLLIEMGNLEGAKDLLDAPDGVRDCGKPVMLAIGFKEKMPKVLLKIAKKRNRLVFKELKKALSEGNSQKAADLWYKAMLTCYGCHQGINNTPKFRKYTPNRAEHSYHQVIVKRFGAQCTLCHHGKTSFRGYED